jgi:hypothetical protein
MSRIFMSQPLRPAGGLPLVGLMVALTVFGLGTASQLIRTADAPRDVPAVQEAALPTAIDALDPLPLPPS